MTTAPDQQSRETYEDGKWYWVEREGWHGEPPTIAPACYKAECDAWYSYIFSGISTPYLKVLEPCELQAARALPASMEPAAWRWSLSTVFADWVVSDDPAKAEAARGFLRDVQPLYTAAQVQAMLAQGLAPGWQAVPVDPTEEQLAAARQKPHPANPNGWDVNHRRIYREMLAAAPRPPAAQEGV